MEGLGGHSPQTTGAHDLDTNSRRTVVARGPSSIRITRRLVHAAVLLQFVRFTHLAADTPTQIRWFALKLDPLGF